MKTKLFLLVAAVSMSSFCYAQTSKSINGKWKLVAIAPNGHKTQSSVALAALFGLNMESEGAILTFRNDSVWVNDNWKGTYAKIGNKL